MPTLLAVAHGTASAAGVAEVERLVQAVARRRPGVGPRLAWLERASPLLADVLPNVEGSLVVVPLLLSTGYHVTIDIPTVLAGRTDTIVAEPLGPDPRITQAVADRLAATARTKDQPVVLIASGSSDPRAADQIADTARELAHLLGVAVYPRVLTDPDWAATVPKECAVANYLLAPGYFNDRIRDEARVLDGPVADPIGTHPLVVDVILSRYDNAIRPGEADL